MPLEMGQGSGDFRETSGRIQFHHLGIRNSIGFATPDAFTQNTPPIVTATANVSTTLANINKKGVLGGSVAFTRPDIGNGFIGGPVQIAAAYSAAQKPLGLFINDAVGNPFENTAGPASGRAPYVHGMACVAVALWETQRQVGGNTTLVYAEGDFVYASVNGLLTNRVEDAYQYNVTGQNDRDFVTVMGVVKVAPDASNSLMVIDMRV